MRYLDPFRMYIFTSAIFFLLFFTFGTTGKLVAVGNDRYLTRTERLEVAMELAAREGLFSSDTSNRQHLALLLDSTQQIELVPPAPGSATAKLITYKGNNYVLRSEPDSNIFSIKTGGGWLGRRFGQKVETFRTRYRDNMNEGVSALIDGFLHRLPYLLFLSLPFFAAILKLLYRRNKSYFYYDHAIFTLYHYIFSFILLLFYLGTYMLQQKTGWGPLGFVLSLLAFSWPLHLVFALKRFYVQPWGKTLAKFVLLNVMGLMVLWLLFVVFIFFSILMI